MHGFTCITWVAEDNTMSTGSTPINVTTATEMVTKSPMTSTTDAKGMYQLMIESTTGTMSCIPRQYHHDNFILCVPIRDFSKNIMVSTMQDIIIHDNILYMQFLVPQVWLVVVMISLI